MQEGMDLIIAVCVDGRNGMLFNGRRQSQDMAQREDLLEFCGERRLWLSPYSAPLFPAERVQAAEDFLDQAEEGEICFVEDRPLAEEADRIEAAVLYHWNRAYPADVHLDLDLTAFELTERSEFAGNSHEKITREIYRRKVQEPEEDLEPEEAGTETAEEAGAPAATEEVSYG